MTQKSLYQTKIAKFFNYKDFHQVIRQGSLTLQTERM